MITLRPGTPADAELIADMSRQTFREAFAEQNSKEDLDKFMNEVFTRVELIKEVGAPGNTFYLAYDGEIPCGYVRMRENSYQKEPANSAALEIARIYVIADSIGKGIGKALMQQCIETAKEKSCDTLWLGVWEHNQRAISFYKKWGFEKFSTHTFMLGNDAQTDWLMKKELV